MTAWSVAARKVPTITVVFWVLKLLTTALGESLSDALINHYSPIPIVLVTGVVFALALGWQITRRRYETIAYWMAVVMVGIFGTMVADSVHVALHVPYAISAAVFGLALAVTFVLWHRAEGTLSIHEITTTRRELFYWATVCATFALGTALGDLTAATLHWGYALSTFIFAAVIVVPGLAFVSGRLGAITTFWTSYVLTRPLGASAADWLGKPTSHGGLGLVAWRVATGLALAFLVVMLATWRRERTVWGHWR
jgi:uncharacterized membrane-anchored protein